MSLLVVLGAASMVFTAWFTWQAYRRPHGDGQSPRSSIVEAWINILIGFSINFVMNLLIIPLAMDGKVMTLSNNWWMGWIFTSVSILRQYVIRRWFNDRIHKAAQRLASIRNGS